MSAGVFALCTLATLGALAIPPLAYAQRRGFLFAADIALPGAPAMCLVAALLLLNAPAQIGWATIIYPFLCTVLSIALLYLRVFWLGRLFGPSRSTSTMVLVAACLGAFLFGATAAPWYE